MQIGQRQFLRWGLLLILIVPLIFGTQLLYPFVVYRTYFFYLAVELLFVLFVSVYGFSWVKIIQKNAVLRAAGIFLLVKLLTDALGLNFMTSFWGNYERMMGWVTWLHLFVYLVMVVTVFSDAKKYRLVMLGTVGTAALVSLYGLVQRAGIAFQIRAVDDRLFSTIGNPAFLGGFLVVAWFICLWLILKTTDYRLQTTAKTIAYRLSLIASIIFISIALYLTATRGALLGFAVAGLLLLLAWAVKPVSVLGLKPTAVRIASVGLLGIMLLSMVGAFAFRNTSFVQSQNSLRRLSEISLTDFSVRSRLLIWNVGWQAFLDRPITGWGEQMIFLALDRHFDPRLGEPWFDSTHNAPLDILVAHGMVGAVAYLYLIVIVGVSLWRSYPGDPVGVSIITAGIVAYGVQSFFIFDTLVVILPLFVLVGYAIIMRDSEFVLLESRENGRSDWRVWVVGAVVAFLLYAHLRSWQALSYATDGYRAVTQNHDINQALGDFDTASRLAYFGQGNIAGIIRNASIVVLGRPDRYQGDPISPLLQRMVSAHQKAREEIGLYSQWFIDPAKVYLDIPGSTNPYLPRADSFLDEALKISPRRIDIIYAKAQVALQQGDFRRAQTILESALIALPEQSADIGKRLEQLKPLVDSSP
ncbi:MAG: O-antigen ligase family protein [Patescibacteria group bacterium]